jgi:hypothetical protein
MNASRIQRALPVLAISGLVLAGLAHGPIGQLANYHDFADHTVLFGIPHACDVLSNLGFALVALWGLHRLGHQPPGHGDAGYRLFLFGLLLTAFGSTYYHLAPDNARLVWDRIPIALACAGLLAAVRGESLRRDSTRGATWLALYAVGSVAWWHFTEQAGLGDLRPYLLLQLAPMVLLPLWQWLGDAPKRQRRAVAAALITYAIAKWTEINDHAIAEAMREVMPLTGHTLKHLLAIVAAGILVGRLIGPVGAASTQQTLRGKTALA